MTHENKRASKREAAQNQRNRNNSLTKTYLFSTLLGIAVFLILIGIFSFLLTKSSDPERFFMPLSVAAIAGASGAASFFAVKSENRLFPQSVIISVVFILLLVILSYAASSDASESLTLEIVKTAAIPVSAVLFGNMALKKKKGRRKK